MNQPQFWQIGGVTVCLIEMDADPVDESEQGYDKFVGEPSQPDVVLRVWRGRIHDIELPGPLFDCGVWSLHKKDNVVYWRLPGVSWEGSPEYLLFFDKSELRGDLWVNPHRYWDSPFALHRPLGELIVNHVLSQKRSGLILHACGIQDGDSGTLFAGTSGSGKTTMGRLWMSEPGAMLLNDDRIVVKKEEGGFWMCSTPWHGEERSVTNSTVPLERVFIIEHGAENAVTQLRSSSAVAQLIARSFPTHWSPTGMEHALRFLTEMSHSVPCAKLQFVPDKAVVKFVRGLYD